MEKLRCTLTEKGDCLKNPAIVKYIAEFNKAMSTNCTSMAEIQAHMLIQRPEVLINGQIRAWNVIQGGMCEKCPNRMQLKTRI